MHRNNIYAWVLLTAWIAGTGCTTLREVPRSEYAARPQRDHVKITTNEGLDYEFDYVRVDEDTLVGYRERDNDDPVPDIATLSVPFVVISGMWGMNFERIPLHGQPHGFLLMVVIQLALGIVLVALLRWKKLL